MDDDRPGYRAARLPVDRIRVNPSNPRIELGDLTELSASIKADGLRQPIDVQPLGGGYFEIVDGHRRYAATVLGGGRRIDALIGPKRSLAEVVTAALVTGVHARPLSLAERQKAVQLLTEQGMTARDIAEQVGVSAQTVNRWRKGMIGPDQPAPATTRVPRVGRPRTTVAMSKVAYLADRFETRVRDVLGPVGVPDDRVPIELVHEMLAELRVLAGSDGAP